MCTHDHDHTVQDVTDEPQAVESPVPQDLDALNERRRQAQEAGLYYTSIHYTHNDDGSIQETATLNDGSTIVEERVDADTVMHRSFILVEQYGFVGGLQEDESLLWTEPVSQAA